MSLLRAPRVSPAQVTWQLWNRHWFGLEFVSSQTHQSYHCKKIWVVLTTEWLATCGCRQTEVAVVHTGILQLTIWSFVRKHRCHWLFVWSCSVLYYLWLNEDGNWLVFMFYVCMLERSLRSPQNTLQSVRRFLNAPFQQPEVQLHVVANAS